MGSVKAVNPSKLPAGSLGPPHTLRMRLAVTGTFRSDGPWEGPDRLRRALEPATA